MRHARPRGAAAAAAASPDGANALLVILVTSSVLLSGPKQREHFRGPGGGKPEQLLVYVARPSAYFPRNLPQRFPRNLTWHRDVKST
eukprot:77279-Prymnesium_polylepis.2